MTLSLSSLPPPGGPVAPGAGKELTMDAIRQLSDVAAITTRLQETISLERAIDAELESLLGQRGELEKRVSALQDSADVLELLRADAEQMAASVASTATLAERVSGKVRELDRAQQRVSECIGRISTMLDRANCIDGARQALEEGDYEQAANCVKTFMQLDAEIQGTEAAESLQAKDQRAALMLSKQKLEEVVRRRFTVAAEARDHAQVIRFARLFGPIGLQQEGLSAFVSYLRVIIAARAKDAFDTLCEALDNPNSAAASNVGATFASTLTALVQSVVQAVEENEELMVTTFGEDSVLRCIAELQVECDRRGAVIIKRYIEQRHLHALASKIASRKASATSSVAAAAVSLTGASVSSEVDPRTVERYLEEMLMLISAYEEYTQYMLQKMKEGPAASANAAAASAAVVANSFRTGQLARGIQELLSNYVALEEFFLVENVNKAIKIDESQSDSMTSSMVDDVFFIISKCAQRAISTSSPQYAAAVLNFCNNLLGNEFLIALQKKLQASGVGSSASAAAAAAAAAANTSPSQGGGTGALSAQASVGRPSRMQTEIAVALNNVDVSVEYVGKLKVQLEEYAVEMFVSAADREKIKPCFADLAEAGNALKQVMSRAVEQLVFSSITPRLRPLLDSIVQCPYEISEEEYAYNEASDPWVQRLLQAADIALRPFQSILTPSNYDACVLLVVDFVVARVEAILLTLKFNQLGGLQLDRDVRSLVGHFSGLTTKSVRDKFARLTQVATVLNLEGVTEILDYWGENSGSVTWRLSPAEVRRVLALRVDFRPEAIAQLKL